MATVGDVVRGATQRLRAAGSDSPLLDAQVLLSGVLGIDRTGLIAYPEATVGDGSLVEFDDLVTRREAGEPVAYLRGFREFMGFAFAADARALIPRPETERLVELAETEIARRLLSAPRAAGARPIRVVDVGTGSGAIAIALALRLQARRMLGEIDLLATDDTAATLDLAKENAVGHALGDRIRFAEADLIPGSETAFDLVLANLPYVPTDAIDHLEPTLGFEPRHALDGGPDGLDVIRRLVELLPEVLAQRGVAFLEIGFGQGTATASAVAELPGGWTCAVEPDLAGVPRVARIER